jgi:hypothetical protein
MSETARLEKGDDVKDREVLETQDANTTDPPEEPRARRSARALREEQENPARATGRAQAAENRKDDPPA